MTEVQRRLSAIMFTDIVGYSALTGRDEMLAMELLQEHHGLLRPVFGRHGGIEVKTIGDSFMVEFPSVVTAVSAAIDMQQTLADRNHGVEPQRQILVRIGVHVGDVIIREKDVFGDGVNIASRIEPLAEPGGICVSEDVARQIRNKIAFPVSELGNAQLKGIDLPMKVYRIQLPWLAPTPATVKPAGGEKSRLASTPDSKGSGLKWAAAALVLLVVAGAAFVLGGGMTGGPVGDLLAGMISSTGTPTDGDNVEDADAVAAEGPAVDGPAAASESDAPSSASRAARPAAAAANAGAEPARRASMPSAAQRKQTARAAFDSGIYADAVREYEALVRVTPDDAEAFYYLGRSHAFSKNSDQAIANLTKATALQDGSSLYHIQLGLVLEEAGRVDNAIVQLTRGLELGGHADFSTADLNARIMGLEARAELSQLVPFAAPAKHGHLLVGSCAGTISVTDVSIAYVTDSDHAFNVWFTEVVKFEPSGNKLGVSLRDGKNLNFELAPDAVQRVARVRDLAAAK
jgi:class 3 adenylate cyclase